MWILSIGVVITILQYAESAATDVVFTCDSCKDKGSSLTGEVGGNLSFFVTVNKASFTSLKINYNATSPIVCTPSIINTNKVTDNRFIIPNTPTKTANKWSMKITLTKLSIADNNAEFTYTYTDAAADEHSGKQVVTVHAPGTGPSTGGDGGDDGLIVIIVIVVLILLIFAVLGLLYKKGVIPTEGCVNMCGGRSRVPASDDGYSLQDSEKGNPKRSAPQPPGPAPTEYAELGPGGRVHIPATKPDKSMYAQVKTENVNYPDPEYEAPSGVIV